MATKIVEPTSTRAPSDATGLGGTIAAQSHDASSQSASMLSDDSACVTGALEGSSCDFYGFPSHGLDSADINSIKIKLRWQQASFSSPGCSIAKAQAYYYDGSSWSSGATRSLSGGFYRRESISLPVTTDLTDVEVAVVQWLAATTPCGSVCSASSVPLLIDEMYIEIDYETGGGAGSPGDVKPAGGLAVM